MSSYLLLSFGSEFFFQIKIAIAVAIDAAIIINEIVNPTIYLTNLFFGEKYKIFISLFPLSLIYSPLKPD